MSLSSKQLSEIGGKITLIVLTVSLVFAVVYHALKYAETNHREPNPPNYKIETYRGFEYPKY